ncbi:poly(ADP-ribose) polymerase family member 14-related sequence 1 isoform X1 [Pangasianodon hypophthalmus]|uniref:poly(ADP-ribose) polymerase family member 14-related sequence 1 isoform X1 n=1 Tax=Pangasianodon hypophthalmus TaxID=310915 RepID=UPI0023071E87|nr:poly(ADP-ribose) polymerase family member 14-related sequence 1 isoform X1 [Pangasianodon hypophthalmus]
MDEEFPFTLFVEGKWDPTTPKLKNKLTIYFQSKKSNGGDCVVQYEASDGQRATVRFKTEEVRQNVLEKQTHEIKLVKDILSLSVYLPPTEAKPTQETRPSVNTGQREESSTEDEKPTSPESKEEEDCEDSEESSHTSAVIKNIQNLKVEFLDMLVENVLKGTAEPKDIEVIPECDCAVVTFTNSKDAGHFIKSCPENSVFKKKNLEISPLEMTTKVKVEDLPSNVNSDYIMLYFEKYGELEGDVEMLEDDKSAIITFQVHADVNKVLGKQHQIRKHPLRVFPYYESLGVALYGKERPILKLPESFIENIDKSVWKYLQEHQKTLDLIMQDMRKHFCHLEFQDPAVRISPLPSILQQGLQTKKLIQTWREKASAEFTTAMSKYKSLEIKIEGDAWAELEGEVHKMLSSEPVTLILHKGQGMMIIAGLAEDVHRTANVAQSTVNRITQRIQREKSSIEDGLSMTPSIFELIMKDGLEYKICNECPELKLSYNASSQTLTLFGIKQDILESKNKILQEFVGLIRRMIELHPSIRQFLIMGDSEELTKELFLSKGIRASLEIKEHQAFLVAKTEKTLKNSEDQLKAQLDHACIDIDDPSVLRRAEWQNLVDRLRSTVNSSVMTVLINTSDSQVVISGFVESVQLVQEQLSDYVLNNSHVTTTLQANKIIVNFIKEHKKEDWCEIMKDNVNVSFEDDTISLSGPRLHVSMWKLLFENLLSSVYCCNFSVDKPGAKKFFKSKELMIVETAKIKMGCVVELVDEHDRNKISSNITGKKRVRTPDGVEIVVNKSDMCFYPVDAIVNAANETLDLSGGLSKALSDAAGPQLQEACNQIIKKRTQLKTGEAVLTDAGQLPCKYVIHVVGPDYDSSNPQKAVTLLNNALRRSLNLADREYCQTLAIPAISSGNRGFPLDLCADTIVSAVKEFIEFMNGDTCLKEIHLIDKNDKTIAALEAAVQNVYGGSSTSQDPTFRAIPKSSSQQQNLKPSNSSNQGSSQSVKTNEGLTVTLAKCNIQDTSVDVVVNSISSDLALNHGVIAQAILAAAGPQIQTLLNQQATGPANSGAVFVTSGCNLKNKLVFHAVAPHWDQGQGSAQTLEGIMDKCLSQAEQQKQGSIVFPAIGTGKLGFPKALVATIMLDSVLKFSKNRTSHHVQEVMFALHPSDHQTIQAFTDEYNKRFNIQSSSASGSTKGPFSKVTSPKTGIYETTMGGVMIQVLSGDITKETTDVIVNSTNENFTLKSGVSKAVLDGAGPNVEAECQQLGAQQNKGLIMTQQGNLQCKKIIHISAKNNLTVIQQRVKQALEMCVKHKFSSIAFPAFGTGQGGVNPGHVADSMMDGIVDFLNQTPQSSLRMVRIVIFQAPMLVDFHQSMLRREATEKQKNESTWSRLTSFTKSIFMSNKTKVVKPPQEMDFVIKEKMVTAVCFSICGPSQTAVDETKQFLEKLISDELAFQPISDAMILTLSDKDRQRIQELQRTMDVSVKIEHKAQAATAADSDEVILIVEGLSRDVLLVVGEINTMLKTTREEMNMKENMKLTAELVDWQYQQGGQYHSFDLDTNFQLEKAFTLNSQEVDIKFKKKVYKVRMPEGPAVSTTGGNQMEIRRVDKMRATENLPEEWSIMGPNELHKVCPLQTGSKEYNDVLGHFRKTCNHNVLKIERIQNPRMWKNYQTNKQYMEQMNGHQNNEKMLFHGTREESINHINQNGFNRSYAGKNAAAYGKGTYFALNASYSSQNTYSVPNAQGQKRMYYCRVLTGDYTLGNATMIDPPAKTANGTDLYDTVVDNTATPTIFVVFRDCHAYPEYLITFT